jgi:acyl transferase domain-containing protein
MEPMLEEFRRVVEGLSFKPATIPAVSTVTGGHTDAWSEPGYWVEQVRATVRYAEAVHTLTTHGATTVLEIGPDTTLTTLTHHCLDHNTDGVHDTAADTHRQVLVLPALRDPDDEVTSVLAAVGRLWTEGVEVDRGALVPSPRADARRLDLPTYAFQRERFWLDADVSAGDVGAAGLAAVGHPLLGAVTELPAAGGLVLSGRVSCGTHRWLADHRVAGAVLFPGTAFLELARCAGEQAGRYRVEELTLESPLAIGEAEVIHLSVGLDDPDEQGRRAVWIFSRHERSAPGDGEPWVRHATGVLVPDEPAEDTAEPEAPAAVWPPAGAVRVDVGGVYEGFAGAGVEYGPVFQGLRGVWRSGGVVFAEVGLPEEEAGRAGGFGVHPALLDAALQAAVFCEAGSGSVVGRVPFSWRGVRWHARGARVLRVRLVSEGEGRLRLSAVDPVGAPVIDIGELDLRELDRSTITAPVPVTPDGLFRLGWVPLDAGESLVSAPVAAVLVDSSLGAAADAGGMRAVPSLAETVGAAGGTAPEVVVVRVPAHEGADVPAAVRAGTAGVLALMQEFVADDRFARSRLMLLTEGAVTVEDTDRISIPAAAVWGLVRSAQLEHPGRFVLVDTDGRPVAPGALSAAVGSATSELAVRDGRVCVPRLTGVPRAASTPVGPLGSGVVVVSGGLGGLGGVVARHVVTAYGVRDVVLVSRRGERSPGAAELVAELSGLGARVAVVAADVSDRAQVADVAAQITRDRRLSAVLHVAGVVDDGVIGALSPSRLDAVLGPKLDGGWWWHEVTSGLLLDAFVVFSSASGVLGSAGQGNYAAANAAVEALAVHRRSLGLPGVSIAWGLWEQSTGITAGLSERDRARMASAGMAGLSTEHALRLLDAALAGADPAVTAIALDPARINTTDTTVPYLLRQLTPRTQPATAAGNAESYRHQLAAMSRDEQTDALVRLVRGHAAAVLGHSAPDAVRTDQPFQEMGFDSLGVVKLRNALSRVTGVALPASLAFDHPNVAALAAHLRELLIPARRTGEAEAEEQLIRRALQEIPLTRLREAGLMDNLLELAGLESSAAAREDEAADLTTGIENMDAQSLITLALGGAADDDVEDTTR